MPPLLRVPYNIGNRSMKAPIMATHDIPRSNRRSIGTVTGLSMLPLVLLAALCVAPSSALAEDIDTNPTPDELQLEIERTAAELEAAEAHISEVEASLEENSARLAELEAQIPLQQKKSDAAVRELYKAQQRSFGVLDILLGSESLGDFLENVEYVDRVTSTNIQEINRLKEMKAELEGTQAELETMRIDAAKSRDAAEAALAAAQEARAEAQRKAEEEARRQAEQAAAAAAAQAKAEATQAAAEAERSEDETEDEAKTAEPPSSEEIAEETREASDAAAAATSDGADWSTDKATFVAEWAGRIDAYLAGSPLSGQGTTFASAAWDYGVDPRWSPAISCIESSKGEVCFLPCNAWGWGSESWGSWEEAINDHVQGLARGYGYTVSYDAAAKYCPPNADFWYERCVEEMNKI